MNSKKPHKTQSGLIKWYCENYTRLVDNDEEAWEELKIRAQRYCFHSGRRTFGPDIFSQFEDDESPYADDVESNFFRRFHEWKHVYFNKKDVIEKEIGLLMQKIKDGNHNLYFKYTIEKDKQQCGSPDCKTFAHKQRWSARKRGENEIECPHCGKKFKPERTLRFTGREPEAITEIKDDKTSDSREEETDFEVLQRLIANIYSILSKGEHFHNWPLLCECLLMAQHKDLNQSEVVAECKDTAPDNAPLTEQNFTGKYVNCLGMFDEDNFVGEEEKAEWRPIKEKMQKKANFYKRAKHMSINVR